MRTSVIGPGKGTSGASAEASQVPSDGAWNIGKHQTAPTRWMRALAETPVPS